MIMRKNNVKVQPNDNNDNKKREKNLKGTIRERES